jgi:hypothetical protein
LVGKSNNNSRVAEVDCLWPSQIKAVKKKQKMENIFAFLQLRFSFLLLLIASFATVKALSAGRRNFECCRK